MKLSLLFFTSLIALVGFAQKENYFKEKNTSVAEHFVNSEVLKEATESERHSELTRSEGFIIDEVTKQGSVFTKHLHRSGKVIFNSEAGDYLNDLKSKLLENYPAVDKLVHVYITENGTLNAFATVNNNIYINVGLLARVENEAQLAFILSHEIMHIVNEHIINESLKVNEKADTYNASDIAMDNDILQLYKHEVSRDHETEADVDGFTLFLQHNYDAGEGKKALELLRKANEYTIDIPLKDQVICITDTAQYVKLMRDYFEKSKKATEKEKDELMTHPLIEDRIDLINELYADVDTNKFNGVQYLVSEAKFKIINEQAKSQITRIFSEDLDFISLFLYSSARLKEYNDESPENLNYLGYALQGLVIDKVKDYKAGDARSTNPADSVFSYFYNNSKDAEFFKWGFEAISELNNKYNDTKVKSYYNSIVQTIVNTENDSLNYVFGDKKSDIALTKVEALNGLNLDDLSFNISPFADMTRKSVKTFNEIKKDGKIEDGKVAIVNMNNIKIRKEQMLSYDYYLDLPKTEELDRRTDKVWGNMEEDFSDKVISLIPNPNEYYGGDYELYDKLNQWTQERLYFDKYFYVSIHNADIAKIIDEQDIKYSFSSINIEIKSFSFKSFIAVYFSPFVMPLYLPQLAVHVANSSTRKYQLSLVYNIETGALKYWDKRTYLEPSSTSQLQMVYNDVFNSLLND